MPIVQDRLIKLVAHADVLLDAFDMLRIQTKKLTPQAAIMSANAALDHVNDKPTREVIQLLSATISQMVSLLTEIEIPQELRNNISEERLHFKLHRKANEHLANFKKYKRKAEADMAAAKAQIPNFFLPEENAQRLAQPIREKESEINDPEFEKVQAALHKKFWPQQAAEGSTPQAAKAASVAHAASEARASGASGASQEPLAETLEEIKMRSSKYAPGVLATSAPSNEEQNKIGISSPDKPLF